MANDEKKAPQPDAATAIAGICVMLGTILASTQSLVKLATELKPLNETIARHRELSTKQLDFMDSNVAKLVGAFARYDATCRAMAQSFDEAAQAHNESARERAQQNASLDDLGKELRKLVAVLTDCTDVIKAVPTLIERHVSAALARETAVELH